MAIAMKAELAGSNPDDFLAHDSVFAGLEEGHRRMLNATATRVELSRGQELWRPGMRTDYLYLMLSGLAKRSSLLASGREHVLDILRAGDCLGLSELLAQRPYASYLTGVERSTLIRIDGHAVHRVIEAAPMFGLRLAQSLAVRQLDSEDELGTSRCGSSSQRVLEYLLKQVAQPLPRTGETQIRLNASKQLVALRLGMKPETFSRALRDLSDAGLLILGASCLHLQNGLALRWQRRMRQANPSTQRMHLVSDAGAGAALSAPSTPASSKPPGYAAINMAGRQRMLSQRVAKYWLMLGGETCPAQVRKHLNQSIELFDSQHLLLADELTSKEQVAAHLEIGTLWQQYRAILSKPWAPARARELFELNEALLLATNRQVELLSRLKATPQADFVNVAGRQRMLAQRMAKLYLFMAHGIEQAKCEAGIASAESQFAQAMTQVATIARVQPKLENQLSKVSQYWSEMQATLAARTKLTHGLTHGLTHAREASLEICSLSDQLTRQMDSAVCLYARMAEAA